jgi:hypothetical protein
MTKIRSKGESPTVFISYSGEDREIVEELHSSLEKVNIQTWVSLDNIPIGSTWKDEIERAIKDSDAVLIVFSSDSLKSKAIANELEISNKYNKKIIPIIYREPDRHGAIEARFPAINNWVYLRNKDELSEAVHKLTEEINIDFEQVQTHAYLMERALEWARSKKKKYLLRGSELINAERWISETLRKPGLQASPLHLDYILASRKAFTKNRMAVLISGILIVTLSIFLSSRSVFAEILNILTSRMLAPLSILIISTTLLYLVVMYYNIFRENQSHALRQQLILQDPEIFQDIDFGISELITLEASNDKA